MSEELLGQEGLVSVECRFVRERNALLCAADFGPVFMDLYLHLGQSGLVLASGTDEKLKQFLGVVALHAASRPRAETCAWTLHLEKDGLNLFAVAENPTGHLVGQAFSRNVKSVGRDVLHTEASDAGGARRKSVVDLPGGDILQAADAYYEKSEQRPARFFSLGGDSFAVVVAQPDCDLPWLAGLDAAAVASLLEEERRRAPLEMRVFRFACGCSPTKIAAAIGPALRGSLEDVFGDASHLSVSCPRCGLKHEISRDVFGAPDSGPQQAP